VPLRRLGRRFIGIEREAEYARRRGAHRSGRPAFADAGAHDSRGRRVAFASLIERGLRKAGATLTDAKGARACWCAPTAWFRSKTKGADAVGSIHRIGALAQGLEACNGWAYWHVEEKSGLKSIDALRAVVRAEMPAA
jgi:modification methylase